jgi:hypothetical protein
VQERSFITKYTATADGLRVKDDDGIVQKKDLYAILLTSDPDSPVTRATILQTVLSRISGTVQNPHVIEIKLGGVVRADVCVFKETFELSDPLPAARAKVVISLKCPEGDISAFDRCVALEEALEAHLNASKLGFVDGHDVGQGEFNIFVYGPRKKPLQDAISVFLSQQNRSDARLK